MTSIKSTLSALGITIAAAVAVASAPAAAATLYDNGPANGTINAWTINYGYAVSDSFTLAAPSTLTGVEFAAWSYPGDVLSSVDWAVTTVPGTYPIDGTAAVTQGSGYTNGFGYTISLMNFALPNISLGAGTYYLVLQNANVGTGNPIFWDQNFGPSTATQSTTGPIDSHSFRIFGTTGPVPEPATWAMMIGGFALVGASLRRRKTVLHFA